MQLEMESRIASIGRRRAYAPHGQAGSRCRPLRCQSTLSTSSACLREQLDRGQSHSISLDDMPSTNTLVGATMNDDPPALVYCKRDLEAYRKLLADYKSGRRKSGESIDGRSWSNTTDEQIA